MAKCEKDIIYLLHYTPFLKKMVWFSLRIYVPAFPVNITIYWPGIKTYDG